MSARTAMLALTKTVVVLVIVLALLYAAGVWITAADVRRAYAALEKDGRPMTAEQIIPKPVPDWENAALLYDGTAKQLKAEQAGDKDVLSTLSSLSADLLADKLQPEGKAQLKELMARPVVGTALGLLEQAAGRKACQFPVDWSKGAAILLPHCSMMRSLSRLLAAHALLQAEAGELDAAWHTALVALKVADALRNEPILISQLVRAAQTGMALDVMGRLCALRIPDEATAVELDARLAAMDDPKPVVASMDGERLLLGEWTFRLAGRELIELAQTGGNASSPGLKALCVLYVRVLRQLDHAAYLTILHQYSRELELPYWQAPGATDEETIRDTPRLAVLTRLLVPALGAYRKRVTEGIAAVRVTRVGLALERHKAAHGEYPLGLDQVDRALLPAAPADPFTGKPLVYRLADKGFALYSVGPDGKDNQGKRKASSEDKEWDIPWGAPK